ncbi:PadR family transcriptional regulator [Nonomuraea sp. NBC_01738]|uniref:PadR family transcriptional regulator n=1 Tax=Nonomuraea sp. NBC_01738 TaxID=2976003 RepID=UPI002E13283C|nr:PadR family transcriptional regulator [Nonomuraea sp. NBC_01738]
MTDPDEWRGDWAFVPHPGPPEAPGLPGLPMIPPGMGLSGAPPRVRRGDVRTALLSLLDEGPKNGYQMIQDIAERSRGVWRPSPGSVYPALQALEDEGMVSGDESGGSRTYQLTDQGRAQASRLNDNPAPWDEAAQSVPEDRHELRLLWAQLNEAFTHLATTANDRQIAEAKKLLKQTRKSVFMILAED